MKTSISKRIELVLDDGSRFMTATVGKGDTFAVEVKPNANYTLTAESAKSIIKAFNLIIDELNINLELKQMEEDLSNAKS